MADSLYAKYLRERSDDEIVETPQGFLTYRFVNGGKSVYIVDIYVLPDYRKSGVAAAMADKVADIAREKGCDELLGSVCPSAHGSTISLKVLIGYGMTLLNASENFIMFKKELL